MYLYIVINQSRSIGRVLFGDDEEPKPVKIPQSAILCGKPLYKPQKKLAFDLTEPRKLESIETSEMKDYKKDFLHETRINAKKVDENITNESLISISTTVTSHNGSNSTAIGTFSSNVFASGSNQNSGNFISDRPTTRIHAPPGGVSSIEF